MIEIASGYLTISPSILVHTSGKQRKFFSCCDKFTLFSRKSELSIWEIGISKRDKNWKQECEEK